MRRSPLTGSLAALSLVVALAACGQADEPSAEDVRADLSEELQAYDTDLTADEADCMAEVIVDEVGLDELNDVDFSAAEPEDLADAFGAAGVRAQDDCLGGDDTEADSDTQTDPATDAGADTDAGTEGGAADSGADAPE
jgi:hypothetical protein